MHFISLLRRRLAITGYASLVLAPFVVVAIAKSLQAAAGILTLVERFLLLDPRLPETSGLVNESVDTAGSALGSPSRRTNVARQIINRVSQAATSAT